MYGPPAAHKKKAGIGKKSLRKCIRPLMEHSAYSQDELRAYPSQSQHERAKRLLRRAAESGEPVMVSPLTLLEME
jgi:hypothetical protein